MEVEEDPPNGATHGLLVGAWHLRMEGVMGALAYLVENLLATPVFVE